jgi:hypothetical protein
LAILNPSQIPAKAPIALKITEEKEKTLPPQRSGTYPPAIDPRKSPVMMKVLDIKFLGKIYNRDMINVTRNPRIVRNPMAYPPS